eukprot:5376790-Amphidinium_carterae.2
MMTRSAHNEIEHHIFSTSTTRENSNVVAASYNDIQTDDDDTVRAEILTHHDIQKTSFDVTFDVT